MLGSSGSQVSQVLALLAISASKCLRGCKEGALEAPCVCTNEFWTMNRAGCRCQLCRRSALVPYGLKGSLAQQVPVSPHNPAVPVGRQRCQWRLPLISQLLPGWGGAVRLADLHVHFLLAFLVRAACACGQQSVLLGVGVPVAQRSSLPCGACSTAAMRVGAASRALLSSAPALPCCLDVAP